MFTENNDYDYEEEYYYSEFQQLIEYCIIPTITQTFKFLSELIIFNLTFLILTRNFAKNENTFHIISTLTGLIYIYLSSFLYNIEAFYIIPLVYISYFTIIFFKIFQRINLGFTIGALFISILTSCEFFYPDHDAWLKVRSIVMISMMKILALSFDLEKGVQLPTIWAYSGYIWCPANSVLGPWISYKDYLKGFNNKLKLNLHWFVSISKMVALALIFVCFSNCINFYLLNDDDFNDFLITYREALCFRMSHYFVSHIGSAAMLTAGYNNNQDLKSGQWSYTITNPSEIEVPRSLVSVVINWNIPTHTFLKKYVFPNFLPYGQFIAVFMTYLVSSMLHGLNVEVSVVLLSLGLFSYVQTKFQDAISRIFSICCRVRPCKSCNHSIQSNSIISVFFNSYFTFLTIIYLAYVGCLMENMDTSSTAFEILTNISGKWEKLYFVGHILAGFSIFFVWTVKIFI